MRSNFFFLMFVINYSFAAGGGAGLDDAKLDPSDGLSIQRGAKTFVNYCLGCHEASYMRFNRLGDLGLSNGQIKEFLIFGEKKVGDTMVNAMDREDAELWFGIVPPDLSVIARSRGPDWLYTYLRSFYQDDKSTTGWNNTLFPNVGMPHILWELQGIRELEAGEASRLGQKTVTKMEGALNQTEYDSFVRDLVNYLVFIGEPARTLRVQIGIVILFVLSIFLVLTWVLKKEYWKDVNQ